MVSVPNIELLEQLPTLREIIQLRFSLLPADVFDFISRLTRGEVVDKSEIAKVNSG
jgi:hypothetical protein